MAAAYMYVAESELQNITHRVPQGQNLSRILFLLYINPLDNNAYGIVVILFTGYTVIVNRFLLEYL